MHVSVDTSCTSGRRLGNHTPASYTLASMLVDVGATFRTGEPPRSSECWERRPWHCSLRVRLCVPRLGTETPVTALDLLVGERLRRLPWR